jgi:hypothetical protein
MNLAESFFTVKYRAQEAIAFRPLRILAQTHDDCATVLGISLLHNMQERHLCLCYTPPPFSFTRKHTRT